MKINHQVVVFNAADLNAESTFWARLLGGTVDAEDDWHMVLVNGEPRVGVQLARPTTYPPSGPRGLHSRYTSICGSTTSSQLTPKSCPQARGCSKLQQVRSLPTIYRSTRIGKRAPAATAQLPR